MKLSWMQDVVLVFLPKLLAKKVPRGKVYAVDINVNMIRQAKINLENLQKC